MARAAITYVLVCILLSLTPGNTTAEDIQPNGTLELLLESLLDNMNNLSAKVEVLGYEVKNIYDTVEALNSSLELVASRVEMISNRVINLPSNCSQVENLNSSPHIVVENETDEAGTSTVSSLKYSTSQEVETLNNSLDVVVPSEIQSLTSLPGARFSHKPQLLVEWIIVGTWHDVFTVSLTSLQETKVDHYSAKWVAFEWNSRQFYQVLSNGIWRANLNGTDEELVVGGDLKALAIDSINGNLYFFDKSSNAIRVCSSDGTKCSLVATTPLTVYHIALHHSKSLIFWTLAFSTTSRANMDGTDAVIIFPHQTSYLTIDEDSDRIYYAAEDQRFLISRDLDGNDRIEVLQATSDIMGIAVYKDRIYFALNGDKSLRSVTKYGDNPAFITVARNYINHIALYGAKAYSHVHHPCLNSPCSHLCVPKLDSFVCLCPAATYLGKDGTSCLSLI